MTARALSLEELLAAIDCPDETTLLELAQGSIEGGRFESLLSHLDGCSACRSIVAELAREAAPGAEKLACASIDRFLILDELGRGGMGVVYAAFDPTLDRRVALKLVRPDPLLDTSALPRLPGDSKAPVRAAAARLLAEAQALARLSHPNVVTVFEARAHGEQIYLAMELVPGRSLRELCDRRAPWREVLRHFSEAGSGLQAAHDAGLVHRDFKPDNVLLGDDGRVRVTDFGLAQSGNASRPLRAEPAGTPGYIAPELWLGKPADARSDQFSFSVSLWELLHGARPFALDRSAGLFDQIRRGPLFPARSPLPLRVRRALLRGLRFDPQERHPSLRALIDELSSEVSPERAGAISAALFTPLVGLLAVGLVAAGATAHAVWADARAAIRGEQLALATAPIAFASESVPLASYEAAPPDERLADALASVDRTPAEAQTDAAEHGRTAIIRRDESLLATRPPLNPHRHHRAAAERRSESRLEAFDASLAQATAHDDRDGGSAPDRRSSSGGATPSLGGGGSASGISGGGLKGSSTLAPDNDSVAGGRTLR